MTNTVKINKSALVAKGKVSLKKTPEKRIAAKKTTSGRSAVITAANKTSKTKTGDPLTKKILIEAASIGFAKAAAKTMKVMGYNVIVKDGWIVKKFADGRIRRISKLKTNNNSVVLD